MRSKRRLNKQLKTIKGKEQYQMAEVQGGPSFKKKMEISYVIFRRELKI